MGRPQAPAPLMPGPGQGERLERPVDSLLAELTAHMTSLSLSAAHTCMCVSTHVVSGEPHEGSSDSRLTGFQPRVMHHVFRTPAHICTRKA